MNALNNLKAMLDQISPEQASILPTIPENAITLDMYRELYNVSRAAAFNRLETLVARGKMHKVKCYTECQDGKLRAVSAYVIGAQS